MKKPLVFKSQSHLFFLQCLTTKMVMSFHVLCVEIELTVKKD